MDAIKVAKSKKENSVEAPDKGVGPTEIKVLSREGKDTGRTVTLSSSVFGIEPNKHVLYLDVVNIRNKARQGTAKTKEKSEVTASTRKILKQKGTGNARKGSRKSNILRGGGRVFGPVPRDYGSRFNKKEKKLAHRSALSIKAAKGQIAVFADFAMDKPSTKAYVEVLSKHTLASEKVLWVLPNVERNMVLSSNNVPKNKIVTVGQLNSYDLINATKVLFFESALPMVEQKLA